MPHDDPTLAQLREIAGPLIRAKVRRLIAKAGLHRQDRPDLEQDVWPKLWLRLRAYDPGKGRPHGFLATIIALVTTGRGMDRTAFPDEETELRKRITSIALAGDRLILFDNIAQGCPLGGAALDAALTGTSWRDRVLGRSEMTPELPLHTVFFATGNNILLRGDAQRRVIPCRLETKEEKPEERGDFKYPNLLEHVRAHRPRLVCNGLTILRAFTAAGSPQATLPVFGSYEAWSSLIRQAVFWAMGVDPCATRDKISAADPVLNILAALLAGDSSLDAIVGAAHPAADLQRRQTAVVPLLAQITAEQCPRIAPAFLAEERRALGERWYRQEYACEFSECIDAVFSWADIQAALRDDIKPLFGE